MVEGAGPFPVDMLRYDQCFPCTEADDSKAIDLSFRPRGQRGPYRVRLVTISRTAPTTGRWDSFGFKVTEVGGVAR